MPWQQVLSAAPCAAPRRAPPCREARGEARGEVRSFFTVIKGTPSARRAVRPQPGLMQRRGRTWGVALGNREVPRRSWLKSRGGSPSLGRQLGPLPQRGDARRWPLPQRRSPAPATGPATRRHAVPGDRTCKSRRAVLPRRACCRRESSQSRALRPAASASLRFAPGRPLTGSFPGKNRHLSGGREDVAAYQDKHQ